MLVHFKYLKKRSCLLMACLLFTLTAVAQEVVISGVVKDVQTGRDVEGAEVFIHRTSFAAKTNAKGEYRIVLDKPGTYEIAVFYFEYQTQIKEINAKAGNNIVDFELDEIRTELLSVSVEDVEVSSGGLRRLRSLEGSDIYEAKKSEVIVIKDITANLATNNARQIFAKVPGLNIWESDGAGLQLGIGARGLDPNRTSNFNVRQNGYDISADALGYPESYYTPPMEAIDRIEVVRGAASLQYGTQFGGLLNFVLKQGPKDKPFEVVSRQSIGSFGLFNSFNSVGGTKGKISYYTFFQHKQGDGWRPNSSFNLNTVYASISYSPTDKVTVTGQYTFMRYLARQPGGLTDTRFLENPRQSIRERNWFRVDWNLFALLADYKFSDHWKLNVRAFGLLAGRDALGNLGRIDRADTDEERDLLVDDFKNVGAEIRLVHHYRSLGNHSALIVGSRYYKGFTHRMQGLGPDGKDARFYFLNPERLEGSDYDFPGSNQSLFAENIFNISKKVSVTPGIRLERIRTGSEGYYEDKVLRPNPVTGIAEDSTFIVHESRERNRAFVIAGIGLSYKPNDRVEIYSNFSQNYRAINFNDIRVVNPNLVVDPEIHDERGFNADVGIRGEKRGIFNYDVSLFYLRYNDRIGTILQSDDSTFRLYRYRTNIADSRHIGVEIFGQVDVLEVLEGSQRKHHLTLFGNVALINARYIDSDESAVEGKEVELVPKYTVRTGATWEWDKLQATLQGSFTSHQFSDASNAPEPTSTAVEGPIPSYYVLDFAARYSFRFLSLETGINNITDNMYFTRRAAGYPGPGILPSDGRSFFVTLQVKL